MANQGDFHVEFTSNAKTFSEGLAGKLTGASDAIDRFADNVKKLGSALSGLSPEQLRALGALGSGSRPPPGPKPSTREVGGTAGTTDPPTPPRAPRQTTAQRNRAELLAATEAHAGAAGKTIADPKSAGKVAREATALQLGLEAMLGHLRNVSAELKGSRTKGANMVRVAEGIGVQFGHIETSLTTVFQKLQTSLNVLGEITFPHVTAPEVGVHAGVVGASEEIEKATALRVDPRVKATEAIKRASNAAEAEAATKELLSQLSDEEVAAERQIIESDKAIAVENEKLAVAKREEVRTAQAKSTPTAGAQEDIALNKLIRDVDRRVKAVKAEPGVAEAHKTLSEVYQRGGTIPSNARPGVLGLLGIPGQGVFERTPAGVQAKQIETADVPGVSAALKRKAQVERDALELVVLEAIKLREAAPGVDLLSKLDQFPVSNRKLIESLATSIGVIDRFRLSLEALPKHQRQLRVAKAREENVPEEWLGPLGAEERGAIEGRQASLDVYQAKRAREIQEGRDAAAQKLSRGGAERAAAGALRQTGLKPVSLDDFPAVKHTPELKNKVREYNTLLEQTNATIGQMVKPKTTPEKRGQLSGQFDQQRAQVRALFAELTESMDVGTLKQRVAEFEAIIKVAEKAGGDLAQVGKWATESLEILNAAVKKNTATTEQNTLSRAATKAGTAPLPVPSHEQWLRQLRAKPAFEEAEWVQRKFADPQLRPQPGQMIGKDAAKLATFIKKAPVKGTDPEQNIYEFSAKELAKAEASSARVMLAAGRRAADRITDFDGRVSKAAETFDEVSVAVRRHISRMTGGETTPTRYRGGKWERDQTPQGPIAREPIVTPVVQPGVTPLEEARPAAAAPRDGQTSILQQILQTLHAMLQCCHEQLARMGQDSEARGGAVPGGLGALPPALRTGAVLLSPGAETAAAGLATETNETAARLKRLTQGADEANTSLKNVATGGRQARVALDVLAALRARGSEAPAIREAGGTPIEFARQLRAEKYTVREASTTTADVYGGDEGLRVSRRQLAAELRHEAATARGAKADKADANKARRELDAALRARADREEQIASIEGKFTAETRAAIAQMQALEKSLGNAKDSLSALGKIPEVGQARAKVAGLLATEPAIGKGPQRQQRIGQIVGETGPDLTAVRRQGAFAVESYKEGALQAAEASGFQSTLARLFFGNQSFLTSVAHTAGRFIIRNLSATLVFGIQNAMQTAIASVLEAEQAFVRLSNALDQLGESSGSLRSNLQGVSVSLGVSLEDTYKVAAQLVGVFENPADIGFGTEIILRLEKISQGALNGVEGVRSLRAITSAFGDEGAQSLEHIGDVVTRLQDLTGVNLEDVIEGLASIGTLAEGMNLSLEFTAALVAQISKGTGQSGAASAEQLGRIMARLQSSASQGQLVAMGIGVTQEQFSASDYQGVLEQILKGWDTLSSAQQDAVSRLLGGVREQRAARTFLEGHAALLANAAKAADSYGASAERTAKIMGTLRGEFQQVRSSLVALVQNLVQSGLFDFLGTLVHVLNLLLSTFNTVFSGVNTLIESIPLGSFFRGMIAQVGGFVAVIYLGVRAFRLFTKELAAAKVLAQGKGFLGGPAAASIPGQLSFAQQQPDPLVQRRTYGYRGSVSMVPPAGTGFAARYAAAQTTPTYGLVGNLPIEDRGFIRQRVLPGVTALGQTIAAQRGGFIAGGLRGVGGFLSGRGAEYVEHGPSITRFRTQLGELGNRMQAVGEHLSRAGLLQRGGAYVAQRAGTALGAIPKLDLRLVDQGESVGRLRGAFGSLGGGMVRLGLQMQRTGVIARFMGTSIERAGKAFGAAPRIAAGVLEFALIVGTIGQLFWDAYKTRRDQLTAIKTLTAEEKAAADEKAARGFKQTAQQRDAASYGIGDAGGDVVSLLGQAFIPGRGMMRGNAFRSLGRMITAGVTDSAAGVPLQQWKQKLDDYSARLAQNAGSVESINVEMGNFNRDIDAEINAMVDRQDLTLSEKTAGVALLQKIKQQINDDAESRRRKLQGLANIDRLTDEQITQLASLMDFYRSVPQTVVDSIPGLVPLVEEGLPDAYKERLKGVRAAGASGRPGLEANLYRDMARDIQGRLQQKVYVEPAEIDAKTKEMEGYYQQFYAKMVEQAQVTADGAKALADVVRDQGDIGAQIRLLQQAEKALAEGAGYAAAEGDAAKLASSLQSLQETRRAIVEAAYQPLFGQLDAYAAIIRNPVTQGRLKLQQAELKLNYVRQFSDRFGPDQVRQAYVAWAQAQDELAGNLEELADAQGKLDLAGVSGSVERSAVQATQAAEKAARTIQRDKDAYARAAALEVENRRKFDSLVAQGKFDEAQLYSGAPPPPGFFTSGAIPGQPGLQPSSDAVARLNDNIVGTLMNNVGKPLDSILSQMKLGIPVWVQNLPPPAPGPGALPEPAGTYYAPTGLPTVASRGGGKFAARPGDIGEGARPTTGTAPQYQSRLPADEQSAQAKSDLADAVTGAKQYAQEMEQLAQLRAQTALALIRDPVRRAQLQLNEANRRLGVAVGEGVAEYERALQEQIQAQQSLADAYHELNQAIISLAKAQADWFGNTVESARLGVATANDQLVYAIQQYGTGSTQVIQAQAGLINAQAQYRDTILSEQMETVDFLLQMGDITSGAAIQMLQQLLLNGDLTEKQRRSLLLKIKGLQDDIKNSLSQGFNIPSEIRLPTAYEVRRSLAGRNALRPSSVAQVLNTNTNVTNNNTFNQTVASPAQVQQIAQAVVGILNDQTNQAVRSNQSTPHLVGV